MRFTYTLIYKKLLNLFNLLKFHNILSQDLQCLVVLPGNPLYTYHLSATEFLPQVVDGLRRGLKHTHASIPGILDIILPYIIDGETLKSIQDQDPGEILKLFGESSTIEI